MAVLTAAALGELVVRTVEPQELQASSRAIQPGGLYAARPPLSFGLKPGYRGRFRKPEFDTRLEINSSGLRDREYGPCGDSRRILVLGDSYTFGWGVEASERYADRLEQRIAAERGAETARGPFEVIKAGITAYGTRQEADLLRAFGWEFCPEIVILQFCMGNDFWDNRAPGYRVEDGRLVTNDSDPATDSNARLSPIDRAKDWARSHSHLFVFVRDRVQWLRRGVNRTERVTSDLRDFNRSVDEGLPATRELLAGIAAEARAREARLLLLIVPMRQQIYEDRDVAPEILEYANRVVSAACDSLGIPVLDLLPAFQDASARGAPRLYFRMDRHWTRDGHRVAGDLLYDDLRARGWLAAAP